MLIEFTVTRLDDKIIGIETLDPKYPNVKPKLPLFTKKRLTVINHFLYPDVAPQYYRSMLQQMNIS